MRWTKATHWHTKATKGTAKDKCGYALVLLAGTIASPSGDGHHRNFNCRKQHSYQKYRDGTRGCIMVLFSAVSVKYRTSRCRLSSNMSMLATLPQR